MKQTSTHSQIIELTAATFESEVLNNRTPILIDFWAPWCGPCRAMKPILDEVATRLDGQVRVAQVNVDEQPELSGAFGIRSIPTCVLMKDQALVTSFVGVVPAASLATQVLGHLDAK